MAKRVLIVDDDQPMRQLLMERMEIAGFSTTSAGDAMQAAIQAAALKPDLIIMDMMMPGYGTGADALKQLRQSPRFAGVPVIFLTGMNLAQARRQIPSDPRIRLMGKPPDWDALVKTASLLTGKTAGDKK